MRPLLAFALIAFVAVATPTLADDRNTITVTGTGEVSASPDTAFINSGVTSQGATAREALDANSAAMRELLAALEEAGIAARDIQTSGFSVQPNYVYTDARDENGYTLPPRINGYQVFNTVTVRVRDLDQLGAILDRSVSVGANTVNGISFSVADPSALYDEARVEAFADARRKAGIYAEAAGVELESIHAINESLAGGYPPPQPYMMREAMAADASVPVSTGELSFTVNVSVTWEID